ncbi:hypothetical protein [uncultured Aquimarina sp.]|uniref:hypothetical protein n=1 Tax=uncultured Aquimarina sp. TaxID=575652 RepID=UPI0026167860|nr:hypothetical protein [uncultured Aquimarina sp.]
MSKDDEIIKIEDPDIAKIKFDFEKYKYRIELYKWFIGSVFLVLITIIINYGFKDRAAGLQEIKQYDKYVTELIILNKDPGQKRMLAQFFALVTPSEKLKAGWKAYYTEVNEEYKKVIAPVLVSDSILKKKYYSLKTKGDNLTTTEKSKLSELKQQIEENDKIINPEIVVPSKENKKDYKAALNWESKGFSFLLNKDIDKAILAFRASEDAYNQFHQVYEIAKYLTDNRKKLEHTESEDWDEVHNIIATKYDWKMPLAVKNDLLKKSN